MPKRLPKSIRKFIRKEKARIRREFSNSPEADAQILELLKRFSKDSGKTKPEAAAVEKAKPKAEVKPKAKTEKPKKDSAKKPKPKTEAKPKKKISKEK